MRATHFRRFHLFIVIIFLASVSVALANDPVAKHDGGVKYKYNADFPIHVSIDRGRHHYRGTLDEDGDFLMGPGGRDPVSIGLSGGLIWFLSYNSTSDGEPEAVYEFRSGVLIKGKLAWTGPQRQTLGDNDSYWNFIPEIGSKVIPLEGFHPDRLALRIYNLPGKFVPEEKEKTK
jgi:hypothetical protein